MAAVSDREQKVREKERELERSSRQEARRHLLDARAEVERAIAAVKAAAARAEISAEAIDAAAREARRAVEDAAAGQQAAVQAMDARAQRPPRRDRRGEAAADAAGVARTKRPVAAGDAVRVATLGDKTGSVVEVRGDQARVLVGSLTLSVPVSALTHTAAPPPPAVRIPVLGDVPDVDPVREVDLRGMRVDDVELALVQALDAAVRNDLRELRIIHGKGTGALRERVAEMLRLDRRVASHRWGAWNEGGAGVTVAELR
jgi:DNA mismatch repair protein MutS2